VRLPVDASEIAFITTGSAARPVLDFNTKRHKADRNGEPLYQVRLLALAGSGDSEESELITVKVAGLPRLPARGMPVRLVGLVAQPWSMDDRSGVSFQAARIEPLESSGPAPGPRGGTPDGRRGAS
jgi:hypothetical protein